VDERQVADLPAEPAGVAGSASLTGAPESGLRQRLSALVADYSPVFASIATVVALFVLAFCARMTPEVYIAPVAAPFAIALLSLGLAWSLWLVFRPSVAGLAPRRGVQAVAGVVSLFACLWVPFVIRPAWLYTGPLWRLVQDEPSAERLLMSVLLWVPIGLLVLSVGLATASRRRRLQLWPWAAITIPTFVLMFCVLLLAGVNGAGGG